MLKIIQRHFSLANMSVLSPQVLLSTKSREKFTNKVKQLPTLSIENESQKSKAAVLIPICVVNDEVSLILTLRSSKLNTHAGQMSFPGGKAELNETMIETALRETHEELGIRSNDVDIWTVMPSFIGMNKDLVITPVVGAIRDFDFTKLKPNSSEVEKVYVVPIRSLIDKMNRGYMMYKKVHLPVYACPETDVNKIWGISGFITNLFLMCLLTDDVYDADFSNAKPYDRAELLKNSKL